MSEQLIHIIPLDNNICHPVKIGNNVINLTDLKNFEYLLDSNFERTTVSINNTDVIDLNVRSSWTNILDFWIHCPVEAKKFFDENYVYYEKNTDNSFLNQPYKLLKYNKDDFFSDHIDNKLGLAHKYTCLIFTPYSDYEGGDLILHNKDNSIYQKISMADYKNQFVMVIFRIDLFHSVTPITKGTRYVFKKPLWVNDNFFFSEDDGGMTMDCSYSGKDY